MAPDGRVVGGDEEPEDGGDRRQDPIVNRLKPDPSQSVAPSLTLMGFLGESDRPGFQRLYFTPGLDYFAEFRSEDVLHSDGIPAEQPPFVGEEATRISIRRDATVDYTRTRTARPLDEFDLDLRFRARRSSRSRRGFNQPEDNGTAYGGTECGGSCQCTNAIYHTCETCRTQCGDDTCDTCAGYGCVEAYTDICVSDIIPDACVVR